MYNYWSHHYAVSAQENPLSPMKQVGKTVNGKEVSDDQLGLIASQIITQLSLKSSDNMADLGCGNGLLTIRLAEKVKRIIGIDFTEEFVQYAEQYNNAENVSYCHSDLIKLELDLLDEVNKLCMYEVIQHLSLSEFSNLLRRLAVSKEDLTFFVGGIPDKGRIKKFYDSAEKYSFYLNAEEKGKPHLGRWWLEDELEDLASSTGWSFIRVHQPEELYTAYYRFDAILTKK